MFMNLRAAIILLLSSVLTPAVMPAAAGQPALELTAVLGGELKAPVIDGSRVYVPSGRIITTWDYANPSAPAWLAATDKLTTGQIMALAKLGNHLYAGWMAGDVSGVAVYSLADPDHPVMVNEIDDYAPGPGLRILRNLAAANGHLYLFDSESGVYYGVVDDPEHPVFTRMFFAPMFFDRIEVRGNYLYTRSVDWINQTFFTLYDLNEPTVPIGSGVGPFVNTDVFGLDAAPPIAAGFGNSLTLFDTTDPANVTVRGRTATPPATTGLVLGDRAWSFGFDGLDIWDISNLDQPAAAGHADIDLLGTEAVERGVGGALVLTSTDRQVVLDIADTDTPAVVSQATLKGGAAAKDIALIGDKAVLLQGNYGLSTVDAATLEPLARFDADLPAQLNMRAFEALAIEGNRAYMVAWGYGLIVVDLTDPLAPVELGRFPFDTASEVAVLNGFVYVAQSTGGGSMIVLDATDPANIVARGGNADANEPRRLQAHGHHVFLADALKGGLRIIDVSNPDAPVQVAIYNQDCDVFDAPSVYDVVLDESGTTAYVACPNGMHIVDVSHPAQPARIGWYRPELDLITARQLVEADGDRGWYTDASGIHHLDLSDPADPVVVAITPLAYQPTRLRATGDGRLFAFTLTLGIHEFGGDAGDDTIFGNGFETDPIAPDRIVDHDD